ncbi:hypothetical protein [Nocardia sp. IFM 10818]
MNRATNTPVRRSQSAPARAPRAAAAPKRMLGRPDVFVWLPVAALLEAAWIFMLVAGSLPVTLGLVAAAVVLVLVDCWFNR